MQFNPNKPLEYNQAASEGAMEGAAGEERARKKRTIQRRRSTTEAHALSDGASNARDSR